MATTLPINGARTETKIESRVISMDSEISHRDKKLDLQKAPRGVVKTKTGVKERPAGVHQKQRPLLSNSEKMT